MKRFSLFLIILLIISTLSCANKETKYKEKVLPLLNTYMEYLDILSDNYNSLINYNDIRIDFNEIQQALYDIKLKLLSLNLPQGKGYAQFSDEFLKSIEQFELLTYKLSNLQILYYDKKENSDIKGYNYKAKKKKEKIAVIENLINIQKRDIEQTGRECKYNLTQLKKISESLFNKSIRFPEFLLTL